MKQVAHQFNQGFVEQRGLVISGKTRLLASDAALGKELTASLPIQGHALAAGPGRHGLGLRRSGGQEAMLREADVAAEGCRAARGPH